MFRLIFADNIFLPFTINLCLCLPLHLAQQGQYLEQKKDIYETVRTHISFGSASCAFHTFSEPSPQEASINATYYFCELSSQFAFVFYWITPGN